MNLSFRHATIPIFSVLFLPQLIQICVQVVFDCRYKDWNVHREDLARAFNGGIGYLSNTDNRIDPNRM